MDLEGFKRWMRAESFADKTIKNYNRYLREIQDEVDLDEETCRMKIADFLREYDTTIDHKNNITKAINKYRKYQGIDDSEKLKLFSRSGDKKKWKADKEQIEKLLEVRCWGNRYHNEKNSLFLATTLEAGLRISEAQNLRFQHIRRIREGDKTKYVIDINDSKSHRDRSIPISEKLFNRIQRYEKYYAANSDVVFANPNGNPLSTNTLRTYVYEAAEATEDQDLIDNLSPHDLRHFRAVELHRNGVSVECIKRFLGHAKVETTQTYLKGDDDILFDQMEEKDDRFSNGGEKE